MWLFQKTQRLEQAILVPINPAFDDLAVGNIQLRQ
jgi:hypothetical protein